jgi:hypothetical protein
MNNRNGLAMFFLILIIMFLIFVIALLAVEKVSAESPRFWFRMVRSSTSAVTIQPLMPVQLDADKLEGDNPTTTIFPCSLIQRQLEGESKPRYFLQCDTAIYEVKGYRFVNSN